MVRQTRSLEVALQMVARRREHGASGNDAELLKALRRRIENPPEQDAVALLARATKLYDAAVAVAGQNAAELWSARTGRELNIPSGPREEMRALAPGESDEDYDETLSWVFYVNHMR